MPAGNDERRRPVAGPARRRTLLRMAGVLAAAVLGLAGCDSVPSTGNPTTSAPSSAAAHAGTSSSVDPASGSPGCGAAPAAQPAGTTSAQSLTSGGRQRTFRVHLPAGYSPDRPYGLVLAFHGRGESDAQLEAYSGLDRLPAVVVYPQGLPGTAGEPGWQGTPYAAQDADDLGFAGALVTHLEATLCIDPARIDATGKSDGGGFAALLGCRLADIDAIAPVSGAFYTTLSTCSPQHPVAVLNFHGGSDTVIPYDGDAARNLLSIPAWVGGWVARDACRPAATTIFDQGGVVGQQWSGCGAAGVVQSYRIASGGHTWPGATTRSGPGGTTTAVNATDLIGAFFAAH